MELLIVFLLGVGIAAWYFSDQRSQSEKANAEGADIEKNWVALKHRILTTSAYKEEATYQLLYWRARSLLAEFLQRHKSSLAGIEHPESYKKIKELLLPFPPSDRTTSSVFVNDKLPFHDLSSEEILFLAYYAYNGGEAGTLGRIEKNKFFCNRAIEYLINERRFGGASFLKGLIFKYGVEVYLPPNLEEAGFLLASAARSGFPSAANEEAELWKHSQLRDVKSVHIQTNSDRWKSHEETETFLNSVAHIQTPSNNFSYVRNE